MRRLVLSVVVGLVLIAAFTVPALAATSDQVVVTVTPAFISIDNDPPSWIPGSTVILPDTLYYSNPLGDTTSPTVGGALDPECRFTVTNTSSVAINLTVLFPNHTGGDASTNSNTGVNGATSFGAKTYFSGQASGAWVIAKSAGSDPGKTNLAATTNIKWGLIYESQSDDWTTGEPMSSTVNIAATMYVP